MGRKPKQKNDSLYWRKQITLKGQTLEMFNYDRDDRETGDSQLGFEIIRDHYRRNPPLGFFKDSKHSPQ